MGVAARARPMRTRPGPKEPALRRARVCYDHLAGDLGVAVYDALLGQRLLAKTGEELKLTKRGETFFAEFGVDVAELPSGRAHCRPCLDWSVRRHHLAGALGAAMLTRMFALGWAKRQSGARVVTFTPAGQRLLAKTFSLSRMI